MPAVGPPMCVGDPSIFVGEPSVSVGDPSIFMGEPLTSDGDPSFSIDGPSSSIGDPSTSVIDPLPSCIDRRAYVVESSMCVEGSGLEASDPPPDVDGSTTRVVESGMSSDGSPLEKRVSRLYVVDPSQDDVERSPDFGGGLLESVDPGMRIVDGPPKTIESSMKMIEHPTRMRDGLGSARAPTPSGRGSSRRVVEGAPCVVREIARRFRPARGHSERMGRAPRGDSTGAPGREALLPMARRRSVVWTPPLHAGRGSLGSIAHCSVDTAYPPHARPSAHCQRVVSRPSVRQARSRPGKPYAVRFVAHPSWNHTSIPVSPVPRPWHVETRSRIWASRAPCCDCAPVMLHGFDGLVGQVPASPPESGAPAGEPHPASPSGGAVSSDQKGA